MRSLFPHIVRDLEKKFVLLAGPRQVGKTTLAEEILKKQQGLYLNWDSAKDRKSILTESFLQESFVVFDELHKYQRWKSFLKGVYDKHHKTLKALVTGSARLDIYKKGGDSLFGRYFLYHLHPFSLGELFSKNEITRPDLKKIWEEKSEHWGQYYELFRWGGFPEPLFEASEEAHNRWSLQRVELLVREDLRDLTQIQHLTLVEHLVHLLPERAGSILSINSLKEDLQVAYNTVKSWIDTLEKLYILFQISPYTKKIHRSIQKGKKLYLWDWSQIQDEGSRFENMVASHLWKAVQIWKDLGFGNYQLFFLRDRYQREVDFCITKDQKPILILEAKLADTQVSEELYYYTQRFNVPGIQLVHKENVYKQRGLVTVTSAVPWLLNLP